MIKRNLIEVLRWGLRLHGIGHLVEVVSAVAEQAIFITIEILTSFYLPKEHVHLNVIKSEVHEDCNEK